VHVGQQQTDRLTPQIAGRQPRRHRAVAVDLGARSRAAWSTDDEELSVPPRHARGERYQ
jgi:hypothetical protein